MISAFQSRDFGFGLQILEETLALVNASCHNQNYHDATAANEVYGCILKKNTFGNTVSMDNNHQSEQGWLLDVIQYGHPVGRLHGLFASFVSIA